MAGADDFLPPSFWAAIISCLLISASSICFFLKFSLCSLFLVFLLGCHHLLPLDLCLLHLFFLKFSLCSLFLVFLLFSFGLSLFLLLFCPDLLSCCLFVLHSFQLGLFLGPFLPPLVDVVLQLFIKLILLNSSFPLGEGFISLHGGVRHGFIFIVRHFEAVKVLVKSINTSDGFLLYLIQPV